MEFLENSGQLQKKGSLTMENLNHSDSAITPIVDDVSDAIEPSTSTVTFTLDAFSLQVLDSAIDDAKAACLEDLEVLGDINAIRAAQDRYRTLRALELQLWASVE